MTNIKNIYLAAAVLAAPVSLLAQGADTPADSAAPAPEPKPKWERSAYVGATLTGGNSDTILVTANIIGTKKWDAHEFSLGADAAYGEVESVKNQDLLHGFAQYNRLFSDRFYGYARLDGLHDDISDVQYRFTLGPGAGYYFIKRKDDAAKTATTLSGEVGPSLITENVASEKSTYLALRLGEKFEHKFSDKARVWQMVEILPQVDDFNNFILNAEIGAEAGLTEKVSLKVFLQDTYDNEPAPGRKKNDIKLVSALGYKF